MEKSFFHRIGLRAALLFLTGSVVLSGHAQPVINTQPVNQFNVPQGDAVDFSVSASEPGFTLQYEWRRNGIAIPGGTKSTFSVKSVQPTNCGSLTVAISDGTFVTESLTVRLTMEAAIISTNNNFTNRANLGQAASGFVRSVNNAATKETREPDHAGNKGGKSVWFKWAAPGDGIVTFSTTGSSFDTVLAAYTGSTVSGLTPVPSAVNDDDGGGYLTSKVSFNIVGKTEYEIAVDGYNGASGDIVLNWLAVSTTNRYPVITSMPRPRVILTPGAALNLAFQQSGGAAIAWLLNDQPSPGGKGSTLDVSHITATNVGDYVAADISGGGLTNFTLPSHVQLNIHDDGSTDTNAIALDKFLDAVTNTASGQGSGLVPQGGADSRGYSLSQTFNTTGASKEPGEPNHCGQLGGASTWFVYVPGTNGLVEIDTQGSTFNTILAVYTGPGTNFASLKSVDCAYTTDYVNLGQPSVTFDGDSKINYYVVVDGLNGASGAVKLNINNGAPVAITTPPQDQTVAAGSNATFTVTAAGAVPRTFQWQFAGTDIANATDSSLTVTNVQAAKTGVYSVSIDNLVSSASSSANLALLTLPTVTTDVTNQTVVVSSNVTFVCVGNGTAPLRYQWRLGAAAIASATNTSFTLTNVQTGNAGSYRCVITNVVGAVTSSVAVLTVLVPPAIATNPTNKTVVAGIDAPFYCVGTGSAPLNYQWSFGGSVIGGATNTAYTVSAAQSGNAGSYACVVSNAAGTATSATAVLTVNVPPVITGNPTNQSANAGTSMTLSCQANGTPPLAYQWRAGTPATNLSSATTSSLMLNNVQTNNAGSYLCMVTNVAGAVTSSVAVITVNLAPTITTDPTNKTVSLGADAAFSCSASGTAPLNYQWRMGTTNLAGATNTTLLVAGTKTTSAGSYSCVVSNVAGSATSATAILTVNFAPVISLQPSNHTVAPNTTGLLAVTASGSPNPAFQWKFNGTNIGANSSALSIASFQSANEGSYQVVVSNSLGMATSAAAVLLLNSPIRMLSYGFSSNQFQLQLAGSMGSNYVFESSTNFGVWIPLQTNLASNGIITFTDTNAPVKNRYYRGHVTP